MTGILKQLDLLRANTVFLQLVRFAVTGGLVTLFYAAIYWPLATYVMPPTAAVVIAFVASMVVGRFAHSQISFKGHGTRDNPARIARRFLIVSLLGFGLNLGFTWLLTGPLVHGPTWWPLIPVVFVTPLVTFALNRAWVFA